MRVFLSLVLRIILLHLISEEWNVRGDDAVLIPTIKNSIEMDMMETFPDEESIIGFDTLLQKLVDNGETVYYRSDPKFPVFRRLANDIGLKFVFLDPGEDHVEPTDPRRKVVLRQQESNPEVYSVHVALIR
jgi:hypothetical protein